MRTATAAMRKETLQLKESKKASQDKDAPKRPAGGVYGHLLVEKREEYAGGPQDHHVIKKAGERWKSLPADEMQKMDAVVISRTRSSTVNTMMMQSRTKHAIWRDVPDRPNEIASSAVPSLSAWSARDLEAIGLLHRNLKSEQGQGYQSVRR